jgi:hypothetical protein
MTGDLTVASTQSSAHPAPFGPTQLHHRFGNVQVTKTPTLHLSQSDSSWFRRPVKSHSTQVRDHAANLAMKCPHVISNARHEHANKTT